MNSQFFELLLGLPKTKQKSVIWISNNVVLNIIFSKLNAFKDKILESVCILKTK